MTEERRRDSVLHLEPADPGSTASLVRALGDESWRVRKAALGRLEEFKQSSSLVPTLIEGLAHETNAGLRSSCFEALLDVGEPALDELTTALRASLPRQRKYIAELLGGLGTESARKALLDALDDDDVNVRAAVAEALGAIGGDPVIGKLQDKLREANDGGDLQTCVYVLDALGRAEAQLPFEDLETWVGRPRVTRLVYPLLGLSGDPRAITPLLGGLRSGSAGQRRVAVRALSRLASAEEAVDLIELRDALSEDGELRSALIDTISAEEDDVARASIIVLGVAHDAALAPKILGACAYRSFIQTGIEVVQAMGIAVVPHLLDSMGEVDVETRVLALEVIEAVGDESAVPALLRVVEEAEDRVVDAAVRALGRLGNEDVVPALVEMCLTREHEIRRAAALALGSIGRRNPDSVGRAVRQAIAEGGQRAEWISVLGTLGRHEDVGEISAAVRHASPDVRRAAIEASQSLEKGLPEDTFVFALADENGGVRAAAARALRDYQSERSINALLAAIRDSDPWVVAEAVRSLGASKDERALSNLIAAASSHQAPIAIAALQGLFRANPAGLEPALSAAMAHPDGEVVREAIQASMRLDGDAARRLLEPRLRHRSWEVRLAAAEAFDGRSLQIDPDELHDLIEGEMEPLVKSALLRLTGRETGL